MKNFEIRHGEIWVIENHPKPYYAKIAILNLEGVLYTFSAANTALNASKEYVKGNIHRIKALIPLPPSKICDLFFCTVELELFKIAPAFLNNPTDGGKITLGTKEDLGDIKVKEGVSCYDNESGKWLAWDGDKWVDGFPTQKDAQIFGEIMSSASVACGYDEAVSSEDGKLRATGYDATWTTYDDVKKEKEQRKARKKEDISNVNTLFIWKESGEIKEVEQQHVEDFRDCFRPELKKGEIQEL